MYVTMSIAFRLLIAASNIAVLFNARPLALELSPSRFEFDTRQLIKVLDRTLAEAQEQARQRAERTAAHRRRAEQLQDQIRQLAAAQDWDAVLTINDQLTKLDPAADPDGLASTAREQITRRREAEQAAAAPVEIPASTLAPPHKLETPPTPPPGAATNADHGTVGPIATGCRYQTYSACTKAWARKKHPERSLGTAADADYRSPDAHPCAHPVRPCGCPAPRPPRVVVDHRRLWLRLADHMDNVDSCYKRKMGGRLADLLLHLDRARSGRHYPCI